MFYIFMFDWQLMVHSGDVGYEWPTLISELQFVPISPECSITPSVSPETVGRESEHPALNLDSQAESCPPASSISRRLKLTSSLCRCVDSHHQWVQLLHSCLCPAVLHRCCPIPCSLEVLEVRDVDWPTISMFVQMFSVFLRVRWWVMWRGFMWEWRGFKGHSTVFSWRTNRHFFHFV